MSDSDVKTLQGVVETKIKPERPRLYKVILINDDYTPREFVVMVLKKVFRMGVERAEQVMMTAHMKGVCVIAVFTREIAERKAKDAMDEGRAAGHPLMFSTEPED
jgi:ATP-dependent Clp protease adaptor protein ClpS